MTKAENAAKSLMLLINGSVDDHFNEGFCRLVIADIIGSVAERFGLEEKIDREPTEAQLKAFDEWLASPGVNITDGIDSRDFVLQGRGIQPEPSPRPLRVGDLVRHKKTGWIGYVSRIDLPNNACVTYESGLIACDYHYALDRCEDNQPSPLTDEELGKALFESTASQGTVFDGVRGKKWIGIAAIARRLLDDAKDAEIAKAEKRIVEMKNRIANLETLGGAGNTIFRECIARGIEHVNPGGDPMKWKQNLDQIVAHADKAARKNERERCVRAVDRSRYSSLETKTGIDPMCECVRGVAIAAIRALDPSDAIIQDGDKQ